MADKFTGINGEPIQVSKANPKPTYEGGNTNVTVAVSITDTAVKVSQAGAVCGVVMNIGADVVYVGGADVTSSNGWPLPAGTGQAGHGRPDLYAVCASGDTSTLIVWDEVV